MEIRQFQNECIACRKQLCINTVLISGISLQSKGIRSSGQTLTQFNVGIFNGMFSDLLRFSLEGYIDGAICGWVWDPIIPAAPRMTQIIVDGVDIASGYATFFRTDLKDARIGDGRCAFVLSPKLVPALLRGGLSIVVDGQTMKVSPEILDGLESDLRDAFLAQLRTQITLSGQQLSNRNLEISWQFSPNELSAIEGLEIEIDAGTTAILRQPLLIGAGALRVPVSMESAGSRGLVSAEANLVLKEATTKLATIDIELAHLPPDLTGTCDGVSDGVLRGWTLDRSDPGLIISLRIFIDDVLIGETVADLTRADLPEACLERPNCAFEIAVPPEFLTNERRSVSMWSITHGAFVSSASSVHDFPPIIVPSRFLLPLRQFEVEVALPSISRAAESLFPAGIVKVEADQWARTAQALDLTQAPSILVTVHDAFDDAIDCLNALFENTDPAVPIILVDDASTDPRLVQFLDAAAKLNKVNLIRNTSNIGYTRSVNAAIRATNGDVVLLNSDTRVGPRWLENLLAARAHAARVGTVTAVSNNAGAFSVPAVNKETRLPLSVSDESIVRAFAYAGQQALQVPTGNGFCMFVSRAMLDDVGLFDDDAYPRGYGEENDLAMRGLAAGWTHLLCDTVFVFHRRSASLNQQPGRDELFARSQQRLITDHPYYASYAKALTTASVYQQMRDSKEALVRALLSRPSSTEVVKAARPRVLIILHVLAEGGTGLTTLDLCKHISLHFEVFLFHRQGNNYQLDYFNSGTGKVEKLLRTRLSRPQCFVELGDYEYAGLLSMILSRWQIALVHIRHLLGHSRVAARVVRSHRLRYLVSLHDFYAVCPTVKLIAAEGRYCGGACGSADLECRAGASWPADLGRLRGRGVHLWRRAWGEVLEGAEAVITTSPYAAELFCEILGPSASAAMHIIEHGRDFLSQYQLADQPSDDTPIKLLMLGNLKIAGKGFATVRAIHELDQARRISFHFLGEAPADAAEIGVVHGRYERDRLPELVSQIRPSFVGIFSVWPETYSHTLSEAWSMGIPVIASHLGATGERIRAHGGGVVVDTTNPAATLRAILEAARPELYGGLRASALVSNMRTLAEMGDAYVELYRKALGFGPLPRPSITEDGTIAAAAVEWLAARRIPMRTLGGVL
jgi:GT2 family glycosyltransferase/glycosyltransferase involved in cell wall biosynthesis